MLTSRLRAAWRNLSHPDRLDRDLDDEVRGAFELFVQERVRAGATPAEARRAATLELGRIEQVKDRVRDVKGGTTMRRVIADGWYDVRFALRGLMRRPVFTGVALVTLALGIGANAAIFSVVRAVLLRPLPYEAPDQLLRVYGRDLKTGEDGNLSPADFFDFQRDARAIARMGVNGYIGSATVSGGGAEAERVGRVQVTEGFFPTLGVKPALGRLFSREEDQPGAAPVAVLTDGYWHRRFGGDPGVIGRSVTIDSVPTTIIGVLPPSFRHVEESAQRAPDLFMPYQFDRAQPNRGGHFVRAVARLAPGRTLQEARAELGAIAARLQTEYPRNNANRGVTVVTLQESIVGASRPVLLLLFGAVGLVLLVVCANMANLLLAAGSGRQRELAVRAAIGAGRGRLVRQLVTESVVLGLLGAAGGLLVAVAALPVLAALSTAGIPRVGDLGVDWMVLAFTAVVAVGASLAFGLLPALTLAGADVHDALKQGGRDSGAVAHRRARELLILGEVAVSVVLLVGAALLIESLWRLQAVNPGFHAEQAMAMDVALPTARYAEGTEIPFYQQLHQRIRALPGVTAVGAVNILPLSENYDSRGIEIEDHPVPAGQAPSPQARSVTPGYFGAMGIPLLRGRLFDERDRVGSPLVVIVSESMARKYWPGQDALGRRITFNAGIAADQRQDVGGPGSREVVGIVGDVKHLELDEKDPVPMFYTPHAQQPSYHAMTVIVRTATDPTDLTPAIRAQLADMDPAVPLSGVRTLDDVLSGAVAQPEVRATLLGLFAGLALLLAAVGVYGVVGYLVGQRTHEIGVRMALGASRPAVLAMVVREGMRPVALGIAVGVAGALGLSRLLQAMLFGVTTTDATAYLVACGALVLAGLLATLVPARRALGVDPVSALRSE